MGFFSEWSLYCIHHMIKLTHSTYGILTNMVFVPDQIHMCHLHNLWFSIWNKVWFQFTWYQNETSEQNKNFTWTENQNDLNKNYMLLRYQVSKYGEIDYNGDVINSFQNESHSSIKWIAPKSEHPKKLGSVQVSGKQPIYPSPNPTFCPKWDAHVNIELGEG